MRVIVSRLQSAIEYLTTYGWAILIIAIVASILIASGIISPGSNTAQICLLEAGFNCQNFYISSGGTLTLNILQTTTDPINITAVGCNANLTTIKTTAVHPQLYLPIGTNGIVTTTCYSGPGVPFSGRAGQVFTGSIELNYTDVATGFPQVIYGSVVVKAS